MDVSVFGWQIPFPLFHSYGGDAAATAAAAADNRTLSSTASATSDDKKVPPPSLNFDSGCRIPWNPADQQQLGRISGGKNT